MCENLFRTRITQMNTDKKKQESVKSVLIRVPKGLVAARGCVMEVQDDIE